MLFSSNVFIYVFLPVCFLLYYSGKNRTYRNVVLLVFSIFFYAWGEPVYVLLMLFSVLINYILALAIASLPDGGMAKRCCLILDIGANLLVLGYYKYYDFLLQNINRFFGTEWPMKNIALPIGISFFTFQAMSYVIDVYRHDGKVQKNIINVALYISLFPQLVAGPIVRYQTIADQIEECSENLEDIAMGGYRFVMGLGKKLLLSNVFALIADYAYGNMDNLSVGMAWLGAISYMLQIYFDFSGYSDMAIGMGRMFGFTFLENFNYPYVAKSITQFWRCWHISLGSWFRDYVYIPLGGNRKGMIRQNLNMSVVWILTGIWHGANWTFICWGMYYLVLLMLEKNIYGKLLERFPVFNRIYTLLAVLFGWVLFRAESISQAYSYIRIMLLRSGHAIVDEQFWFYMLQYRWYFIIGIIACMPVLKKSMMKLEEKMESKTMGVIAFEGAKYVYAVIIFIICLASLAANSYNPFIYFNF